MRALLPAVLLAAVMAVPATAAPAELSPVDDLSFLSVNECTGNLTTWTQSNQFVVSHSDVDASGGAHRATTITGDVSTADGFTGHFTAALHGNQRPSELFVGEQGGAITYVLHGPSGQLLLTHEVGHVVFLPDGTVHGSFSSVESRCLGSTN
jgi:hypothetical protein